MRRQQIHIINQSTLVGADEFTLMAQACIQQLHEAAQAWGKIIPHVTYEAGDASSSEELVGAAKAAADAGAWVLVLLDDGTQAGALGYHTEQAGEIFGFVYAKPSFDSGSTALAGNYAVSSVLSHELLETLVDPDVNSWWQISTEALVAAECCDPVEDTTYTIGIDGHAVAVSNYVLPAWADVYAAVDARRDRCGVTTAPFQVSAGGYVVLWDTTKNHVGQVYGETFPEWKKPLKARDISRAVRHAKGLG